MAKTVPPLSLPPLSTPQPSSSSLRLVAPPRNADLTHPVGQAAIWLSSSEAAGVGAACIRDPLLRALQAFLTSKAPQRAAQQQADRPASRGGGRRARRRGQQGGAAGGRGTAGAQTGQGPHLPPRSVGEAPTLLLSAARGMAVRLLALPLDEVRGC